MDQARLKYVLILLPLPPLLSAGILDVRYPALLKEHDFQARYFLWAKLVSSNQGVSNKFQLPVASGGLWCVELSVKLLPFQPLQPLLQPHQCRPSCLALILTG